MNLQAYYPYFFYVAIAVAAVLVIEAIYLLSAQTVERRRSLNRRMREMGGNASTEELMLQLKRERGIPGDATLSLGGGMRRLLVQSGLRLTMTQFVLVMLATGAAIYAVFLLLARSEALLAAVISVIAGVAIPYLIVRYVRSRRLAKFNSQLPEALDIIVRSLRSGHPVPVAMSLASREMPDPLGTEFGLAVDEMTYGLETEQALANMYQRCGDPELALLVTAMSLQTATGGNLANILTNLAKVIRDRYGLRRKVKSLSAEGRISAWGMSILPIILGLYINFMDPRYYGGVWDEPIFKPIMVLVAVWSVVGDFIMFKMINFKY